MPQNIAVFVFGLLRLFLREGFDAHSSADKKQHAQRSRCCFSDFPFAAGFLPRIFTFGVSKSSALWTGILLSQKGWGMPSRALFKFLLQVLFFFFFFFFCKSKSGFGLGWFSLPSERCCKRPWRRCSPTAPDWKLQTSTCRHGSMDVPEWMRKFRKREAATRERDKSILRLP